MGAAGARLLALAGLAAAAGCGSRQGNAHVPSNCPPNATGALQINEIGGAFRGLHLEMPYRQAMRQARRFPRFKSVLRCAQFQIDGPSFPEPERAVGFRDFQLEFAGQPLRLRRITVVASGARTQGGVRIGDPLKDVRARYTRVRPDCHDQTSHDGDRLFPSCVVEVGRYTLYFGGDPISDIELAYHTPTEHKLGFPP